MAGRGHGALTFECSGKGRDGSGQGMPVSMGSYVDEIV